MSRIVIQAPPAEGRPRFCWLCRLVVTPSSATPPVHHSLSPQSRTSPRPDPYAFAQEALRMDIENFVHHAASPGLVFFERRP